MTFPMGGFGTYTPYQHSNPLFQLGGEVNDEDMRAFQDCMLGTGDGPPPPQAQQTQQQQQADDMDFNLSSAYEIPDFDLACAYLDQVGLQGGTTGGENRAQPPPEASRTNAAMMLGDRNGPTLLRSQSNGMCMDINTRVGPYPGAPLAPTDPFSYRHPSATHGSNQSLNSLSGGVCSNGGGVLLPSPLKPCSSPPSSSSASSTAVPAQRRARGEPLPPPLPCPAPSTVKALDLPAPRRPTPTPAPTPSTKSTSSMPAPPTLQPPSPASVPAFQRTTSSTSGSSASSAVPGGRLSSDTRTNSTGSTTSGASSVGSRSRAGEGGGSSRASNGGGGMRRKRNEPKTKTEAQLEKIRERNRILARRTRLRKKMVYESLQKQLTELKRENARLRTNAKQQRGEGGGANSSTWTDGPEAGRESNCSVMDEDEAEGMGCGVQGSVPGSPPHSVTSSQFLKHHGEVGLWSEAAVRRLLAQTQHTFAVTDACAPGHPIMYASPSFLQLTGFTAGQLFGGNLRFLKGPLTDPVAIDNFYRCLERGVETSMCFQTYRADGSCYWAQNYLAPLRNHDGKVIQTVVMQCPLSFLSGSGLDLLDEDDETELEDDDDHFFEDDTEL